MVSQALGIQLFKHRSRLGSSIPLSNTKCGNFPVKGTQHDGRLGEDAGKHLWKPASQPLCLSRDNSLNMQG